MRGKFRVTGTDQEEPSLNLTPLIDVLFVILIIFIVIAPLLEMERVELAESSPHLQNLSLQQSSAVGIQLRRDGTIWLNQREVTPGELADQLKRAHRQFPQAIPQLFCDKQAYFGLYHEVKNAAEAAGYSEMELVLQPSIKK